MFGLAAVHPQSSSAAHLQTARRRDGARRGALGHREDLVDGSDGRQRVAVLDGDAAHLGVVLDCDLEVWEKCGSRERWDSVCCRGKGSSTRREQNIWRSPRCSCQGSQRCTRSRPAQRTCRPLAVGVAPGAVPLRIEKILLMVAMVAGASLFSTVTLPTSVSYLIVI